MIYESNREVPQVYYEPTQSGDTQTERCRRLFGSVTLAVVSDALRNDGSLDARRGHEWIDGNGSGYRMVCEMAGIDPDFLREAYLGGKIDPALMTVWYGRAHGHAGK